MASTAENHELEYRLHQQALLAELGRRALTEVTLDALLEEASRLTAVGMRTEFCKILEYLPSNNRLLVRAGVGWHAGVVGNATVGTDLESPAGYALHTGKPVIANALDSEERFRTPELLKAHGIQRAINVILTGEGKPFGVLEADSRADRVFGEHDIDFMQAVANLLGMAIERKRAHEALREINATLEERVAAALSERRAAEAALAQVQKMEAVGQLTGGVAHDFNNLLTVIAGNLDLAASEAHGSARLEQFIAAAQKGALRGQQLTSQLLAFARRQTLRPENRRVNDLIREFDVLVGRILGEAIDIAFDLAPEAGSCHVDPAQFGATLLNLVVNSRDAMPQGGRLIIRTGNADLSAARAATIADAVAGSYAVVTVEDTGSGMPPDVLARALEPFFTTKEVGQGTGLGLSQVYGFVRQSGGFLSIASEDGKGTIVSLYLPTAQSATADAHRAPAAEIMRGSETILVVEDDEDVRRLVVESLEVLGYRTVVARNGLEAQKLLANSRSPPVNLLLTDVVMPGGMSGTELAQEARQRDPGIKILLTSGYAAGDRFVGGDAKIAAGFPMLSKPYRHTDLARQVRAVLDGDRASAAKRG